MAYTAKQVREAIKVLLDSRPAHLDPTIAYYPWVVTVPDAWFDVCEALTAYTERLEQDEQRHLVYKLNRTPAIVNLSTPEVLDLGREEGRREVYREIAALYPKHPPIATGGFGNSWSPDECLWCKSRFGLWLAPDPHDESKRVWRDEGAHDANDCLWFRATEAVKTAS